MHKKSPQARDKEFKTRFKMSLLLIRKARIPHRKFWTRANILINKETGKIVKVYKTDSANRYLLPLVDEVIDAKEKLVFPSPTDINNDFCGEKRKLSEEIEKALEGGIIKTTSIIKDLAQLKEMKSGEHNQKIKIYYYLKIDSFNISRDMFTDIEEYMVGLYLDNQEIPVKLAPLNNLPFFIDLTNLHPSEEYEIVKKLVNWPHRMHFMGIKNPATIGLLNSYIKKGVKKTYDVPIYEILYVSNGIELLRENKTRKLLLGKLLRNEEIFAVSTGHRCGNGLLKTILENYMPIYFTLIKKLNISKPVSIIEPIATRPQRALQKDQSRIKTGSSSDLIIFNHKSKWKIAEGPLEGLTVRGRVELAILNGKVVYSG